MASANALEHDRATLLSCSSTPDEYVPDPDGLDATDLPPTCYVCASADAAILRGLMVCVHYERCGGAKHAKCGGLTARPGQWVCEPCQGRPRQRTGQPKDWSAEKAALEEEAAGSAGTIKAGAALMGCGLCLSCVVQ